MLLSHRWQQCRGKDSGTAGSSRQRCGCPQGDSARMEASHQWSVHTEVGTLIWQAKASNYFILPFAYEHNTFIFATLYTSHISHRYSQPPGVVVPSSRCAVGFLAPPPPPHCICGKRGVGQKLGVIEQGSLLLTTLSDSLLSHSSVLGSVSGLFVRTRA